MPVVRQRPDGEPGQDRGEPTVRPGRRVARRGLDRMDFAFGFKRPHDLNSEVHVHRHVAACGVVVQKHVVTVGAQAWLRPEEIPVMLDALRGTA